MKNIKNKKDQENMNMIAIVIEKNKHIDSV